MQTSSGDVNQPSRSKSAVFQDLARRESSCSGTTLASRAWSPRFITPLERFSRRRRVVKIGGCVTFIPKLTYWVHSLRKVPDEDAESDEKKFPEYDEQFLKYLDVLAEEPPNYPEDYPNFLRDHDLEPIIKRLQAEKPFISQEDNWDDYPVPDLNPPILDFSLPRASSGTTVGQGPASCHGRFHRAVRLLLTNPRTFSRRFLFEDNCWAVAAQKFILWLVPIILSM